MKDRHAPSDPSTSSSSQSGDREPQRLWRELLGERLRALRHARHETLATVACRANLSLQYLSELERGVKEPSSEIVAALCAALGVTLLDLTLAVSEQLRTDTTAAPGRRGGGEFALAA